MPQIKAVPFQGKTLWDNMEQQEYLINMLNTVIKPQLVHSSLAGTATQTGSPSIPASTTAGAITEPEDDLPF
jgi:hypothetical protein